MAGFSCNALDQAGFAGNHGNNIVLHRKKALLGACLDDLTVFESDANLARGKNRKHWLVVWHQTNLALDGLGDNHFGVARPHGLVSRDEFYAKSLF